MRIPLAVFLLVASAFAADYQRVRVLDVRPFSEPDTAPLIAPNNGHPVLISGKSSEGYTLTVRIGDLAYSANFYNHRHFKSTDIVVGDEIPATLGERHHREVLLIQTPDGKDLWGVVNRKERLQ